MEGSNDSDTTTTVFASMVPSRLVIGRYSDYPI